MDRPFGAVHTMHTTHRENANGDRDRRLVLIPRPQLLSAAGPDCDRGLQLYSPGPRHRQSGSRSAVWHPFRELPSPDGVAADRHSGLTQDSPCFGRWRNPWFGASQVRLQPRYRDWLGPDPSTSDSSWLLLLSPVPWTEWWRSPGRMAALSAVEQRKAIVPKTVRRGRTRQEERVHKQSVTQPTRPTISRFQPGWNEHEPVNVPKMPRSLFPNFCSLARNSTAQSGSGILRTSLSLLENRRRRQDRMRVRGRTACV